MPSPSCKARAIDPLQCQAHLRQVQMFNSHPDYISKLEKLGANWKNESRGTMSLSVFQKSANSSLQQSTLNAKVTFYFDVKQKVAMKQEAILQMNHSNLLISIKQLIYSF